MVDPIPSSGRSTTLVTGSPAPRLALADLIAAHDGHFTASELAAIARDRRRVSAGRPCSAPWICSSELGVVERLDLPSGDHAYVSCARAHHHHVVCSRCGRTAEVADAGLNDAVAEIERLSGFRIDTHRVELFGLCRHCQALTAPIAPPPA